MEAKHQTEKRSFIDRHMVRLPYLMTMWCLAPQIQYRYYTVLAKTKTPDEPLEFSVSLLLLFIHCPNFCSSYMAVLGERFATLGEGYSQF